jgi:hypothetical protein
MNENRFGKADGFRVSLLIRVHKVKCLRSRLFNNDLFSIRFFLYKQS